MKSWKYICCKFKTILSPCSCVSHDVVAVGQAYFSVSIQISIPPVLPLKRFIHQQINKLEKSGTSNCHPRFPTLTKLFYTQYRQVEDDDRS